MAPASALRRPRRARCQGGALAGGCILCSLNWEVLMQVVFQQPANQSALGKLRARWRGCHTSNPRRSPPLPPPLFRHFRMPWAQQRGRGSEGEDQHQLFSDQCTGDELRGPSPLSAAAAAVGQKKVVEMASRWQTSSRSLCFAVCNIPYFVGEAPRASCSLQGWCHRNVGVGPPRGLAGCVAAG